MLLCRFTISSEIIPDKLVQHHQQQQQNENNDRSTSLWLQPKKNDLWNNIVPLFVVVGMLSIIHVIFSLMMIILILINIIINISAFVIAFIELSS